MLTLQRMDRNLVASQFAQVANTDTSRLRRRNLFDTVFYAFVFVQGIQLRFHVSHVQAGTVLTFVQETGKGVA